MKRFLIISVIVLAIVALGLWAYKKFGKKPEDMDRADSTTVSKEPIKVVEEEGIETSKIPMDSFTDSNDLQTKG